MNVNTATAGLLYAVPVEDVTPEQRRAARVINHGILYSNPPSLEDLMSTLPLPPDVSPEMESTVSGPRIAPIVYVYGDGAVWKLDEAACLMVSREEDPDAWLTYGEATGAKQDYSTGRWSKLPSGVYQAGGKPGASRNGVFVVSYDQDVKATCRDALAWAGVDSLSLSALVALREMSSPERANLLGYVLITGNQPKKLKRETWAKLDKLIKMDRATDDLTYSLIPQAAQIARGSALGRAAAALTAAGYRWKKWIGLETGPFGYRGKYLTFIRDCADAGLDEVTLGWSGAKVQMHFQSTDVHGRIRQAADGSACRAYSGDGTIPPEWR